MSWVALLGLLLQLVVTISSYISRKDLAKGELSKQLADQLTEATRRLGVTKHVVENIARMSDTDIRDLLSKAGDFRD